MSIYGYILCNDCKKRHWIKDSDTELNGDLMIAGRFFEDHRCHRLEYVHEEDERTYLDDDGWGDYKTDYFDS
jgi:hypothetical protein